jgi:hypothetical protein
MAELEDIGPEAPPGARAQRDALKLLARSSSTPTARPRISACSARKGRSGPELPPPLLMVNDLGLTFGHAGL